MKIMGASPSATGLSSLRDRAPTGLAPDGLQSTGAKPDAATELLRAIRSRFRCGGFTLEEIRSRRWASVTFTGARHEVSFRLEGEDAERDTSGFLSNLNTADFDLTGHLLADISLVSEERRPGYARICIEALTVEES